MTLTNILLIIALITGFSVMFWAVTSTANIKPNKK